MMLIMVLFYLYQSQIVVEGVKISPLLYSYFHSYCKCENRPDNLDVSKTKIKVYNFQTNSNNSYGISNAAESILNRSDFDSSQCIQIYVPGVDETNIQDALCAFSKIRCNGIKPLAIIVDHSAYAKLNIIQNLFFFVPTLINYVLYSIKPIGRELGIMVAKILKKVSRDNIDMIGHSIGAHIIGYLANKVKAETGKPLQRIFLVEPGGICFEQCLSEHVKAGAADVVISFHCNSGIFGSALKVADYDFYVDNGQIINTCGGKGSYEFFIDELLSLCSHTKCVSIALNPAFRGRGWDAVKCSSAEAFTRNECHGNERALAGYRVEPKASPGVYFFTPDKHIECQALIPLSLF